ncbi:MAG: gfo/Idh/MocA family oxidoreductase [Gemmataceae bacterium]|mgnify:CR=1 FL=1
MTKLRMGVVGVGHLGKEHARILSQLPDVELVAVVDIDPQQARTVARRCGTRWLTDHRDLLDCVDAATIAVPTSVHRDVAVDFLRRGIPIMVEKPLAATLEQAEELADLARTTGTILQVGHIERFNPALLYLEKRPIRPKFVDVERLSGFSGRSLDIGVVLDLMIHDLDVLTALVKSPVRSVEAVGVSLLGLHEDIANARLVFENGCVASLTASRVSVKPLRKMRVYSPEGYVSLDFGHRQATIIQPSERVRREGFDPRKLDLSMLGLLKEKLFGHYLEIHEFEMREGDQLTLELSHFVDCVRTGQRPKVSGEEGRNAIALATRILDKIRSHQWEGHADGPIGPTDYPAPLGPLVPTQEAA